MSAPKVSILLPNLNTFPYLQERIDTIFDQTFTDWELVVSDNYSEDGAWEFFQDLAKKDERVKIAQAPKEGLYPNWNNCVKRAIGEYVYIATSDDTMAPDCIEKMVAALEKHPDCDIAHCPLLIIDQDGKPLDQPKVNEVTVFAHGLGELADQAHIRRAPYDGLIHLTGMHVTLSITQILIRRSIFERTGLFSSKWGSISDFHWEMKAGLVSSTVHVPDTWASWRLHPHQATASVERFKPEHDLKVEEMIDDALASCETYLDPTVLKELKAHWLAWNREARAYYAGLRHRRGSSMQRRIYQVSNFFTGTQTSRREMTGRIFGIPKWGDIVPSKTRSLLESLGIRAIERC